MGPRLFAGIVALTFFYVISPLIFPIAMGGVLAVVFFPWLVHLERKKIPTTIGSGLLTLGITAVLILPMSFLIFFAAKTGIHHLQSLKSAPLPKNGFIDSLIQMPKVHHMMEWVTDRVPVEMSALSTAFQDMTGSVGARLAELMGEILSHLPGMAVSLGMMVVSIYFFLVDGPALVKFLRRNSIFDTHQTDQLITTLAEMCRSVIFAAIVSGGSQAVLESLACGLTGTPNVALIGLLVFVGSFIPLVGSAPITLGIAIREFVEGRQESGIILSIMVFIIMAVDNAVRPIFLRGTANLHPFLAFIAAFGGLQTFGFLGVFLGPIVAALFVVVVKILVQNKA